MRSRKPPRSLGVISKSLITPDMLRVTLGGAALEDFPDDQDGAYVKLDLPVVDPGDGDSLLRTYTIRYYRATEREIDIDFVLHESEGPAANWAQNCEPGDLIDVGGPGPKKLADHSADWFVFAGDMSALPAIAANLEALPSDAMGYALLEIIDDRDRQEIRSPEGIRLDWIVNPHPETENTVLLDAVKRLDWLEGEPYFWIAGEFSQSLAIRDYLRTRHDVKRDRMYASSYWQIGQTEDGHRVSKAGVREATA